DQGPAGRARPGQLAEAPEPGRTVSGRNPPLPVAGGPGRPSPQLRGAGGAGAGEGAVGVGAGRKGPAFPRGNRSRPAFLEEAWGRGSDGTPGGSDGPGSRPDAGRAGIPGSRGVRVVRRAAPAAPGKRPVRDPGAASGAPRDAAALPGPRLLLAGLPPPLGLR